MVEAGRLAQYKKTNNNDNKNIRLLSVFAVLNFM